MATHGINRPPAPPAVVRAVVTFPQASLRHVPASQTTPLRGAAC